MRKPYIFGLVALVTVIVGSAFADEVTLSTYYPAPHGVYNNMVVMNSLGIGTTQPEAILDVSSTTSGFLPPRMSQDDLDIIEEDVPAGSVAYNTTTNELNYRDDIEWKSLTGSIEPDYDSGWRYDKADKVTPSHRTEFTHNLNYFPKRIVIWFATSDNPTTVYPILWGWSWEQGRNPCTIELTKTQLILNIWNGHDDAGYLLHGTWVAPTSSWTLHTEGYWRVFLWR